jgi:hypothetical protein
MQLRSSKVGGEGSLRVGTADGLEAFGLLQACHRGGQDVRREDHQSAAFIFPWFLRILTSNLESLCPTSSLTRTKVSPSRPSAIQDPWPTCLKLGPTTW